MKTRALLFSVLLVSFFSRVCAEELTLWVWTKNVEQPAVFSLKVSEKRPVKQMQGDYHKIVFPVVVASTGQSPERVAFESMDVFTGYTILAEFRHAGISVTLEHSALVDDAGKATADAKNLLLRSMEFIASRAVGESDAGRREVVTTSRDHPVVEKIEYRISSKAQNIL